MDNVEVIVLSAVFAALAIRLYQKYFKKDLNSKGTNQQKPGGHLFSSGKVEDEYEPYSKK